MKSIDVISASVMRDQQGQSRGFGFVFLENKEDAGFLVNGEHYIDGRRVVFKRAIPEDEIECRKLFIGGLPLLLTEDMMFSYFAQFGEVTECLIMKDRYTGRPRGFGFISYKRSESVDLVLENEHFLDGKHVEVKKAESKAKSRGTPDNINRKPSVPIIGSSKFPATPSRKQFQGSGPTLSNYRSAPPPIQPSYYVPFPVFSPFQSGDISPTPFGRPYYPSQIPKKESKSHFGFTDKAVDPPVRNEKGQRMARDLNIVVGSFRFQKRRKAESLTVDDDCNSLFSSFDHRHSFSGLAGEKEKLGTEEELVRRKSF
eukprot:TRINITY_DN4565_c0_g2_i1.p1 TRINITY_DN4565_c0_g2~~TRINITY_DN4565_c0_g2_i1.p1  ORF type:complete len:314 (-),score=70.66 TRINITY_DN4565_c0_g2_i1:34-975(-)